MNKCLTCEKPIEQTAGKRQRRTCSDICRLKLWKKELAEKKNSTTKLLELPADYFDSKKIGILKTDGTIEIIEEFSQLPEIFQIAARGIYETPQNKPQQTKREASKVVVPAKTESSPNEPKKHVTEENEDAANLNFERIAKIKELLLSSPKYLPKEKRSNLERELKSLTNLPQTNTD